MSVARISGVGDYAVSQTKCPKCDADEGDSCWSLGGPGFGTFKKHPHVERIAAALSKARGQSNE